MKTISQRVREIIGNAFGAEIVEVQIEKAIKEARDNASDKPVSFLYDPLSIFMGREWLVKTGTRLTFMDLRSMAKNPIIGSIIQTRLNQVASFCRVSDDKYEMGFSVSENKLSKTPVEKRQEVASFMENAGFLSQGESNLNSFIRKFTRDSLILDQGCAEIVPRRNGIPAYFLAVDGASIRRLKGINDIPDRGLPAYCQIIDEVIKAEYSRDQLIFGVRNPSTDLLNNGYGFSELEMLITTVTTLINAEKYNSVSLSQGGTKKGVLVVKGEVDNNMFASFRQDFKTAVQNAATSWRPPVIRIGKDASIDWVALDQSNRDLEYAQLFEFIVKTATSVYQISPEEVNWTIGQAGSNVSFNSGAGDRLRYSKDKGLRPLLTFLGSLLDSHIVKRIDPNLRFDFTGLTESRLEEAELRIKEVAAYKTVNEVRLELGLDEIEGGDVILSPNFKSQNSSNQGVPSIVPDQPTSSVPDLTSDVPVVKSWIPSSFWGWEDD